MLQGEHRTHGRIGQIMLVELLSDVESDGPAIDVRLRRPHFVPLWPTVTVMRDGATSRTRR